MKKQFDPSLSSNDSEDILISENDNIKFTLDEKEISSPSDVVDEVLLGEDTIEEVGNKNVSKTSHHSHHSSSHSSSSGHHHHSSSGSHSSSSGEHHHSSSSHHSSSGSHHSSSSSTHHHSSSSSSHHSSKKTKKKMKTWVKVIIIIILVIALLIAGTFGAFVIIRNNGKNDLQSAIATNRDYEEIIEYNGHQYQYNSNLVTIAFMGIDTRDINLDRDDLKPGCADSDIVVTIDTTTGEMKLVSIPRDTMVDIDIYTSNGVFLKTENVQLTLAYSYGDTDEQSCKNVVDADSRILYNVPIDKYFALDLEGIKPINDAIGGVTLEALHDVPSYNIVKGQTVTLKGDMAEAYVRTRDMDSATAAQERGKRQVQYLKAFASQVIPAARNDFSIVSDLYTTASEYSETNITLNNVTYLASLMLQKNISSFETYSIEGTTTTVAIAGDTNGNVNAQFTPDPDQLMQTVLDVFYIQIN